MGTRTVFSSSACIALLVFARAAGAQDNVVPNPGFEGSGGQVLPIGGGTVNAPSGAPDNWRAFAVGGTSSIDLEVVPVAADELFAGSPATNAVLLRLNGAGADQGFDDDNGRFPIVVGLDYHAEFYVKSANADASVQLFNFGFPLFDGTGKYLRLEPGGSGGNTATADWALFTGPTFKPADPVKQGHISWRCIDEQDGSENAILLALPFVTGEGMQVLPSDIACTKAGRDVTLTWTNHAAYDSLEVLRDGVEIASLAVGATTHTDAAAPLGDHTYQVLAALGPESGGPSCAVSVFDPPAPGAKVSVDLGETDVEDGLRNTFRDGFSDGENAFAICGPEGDLREGRSNLGADDPTPDAPDSLFYFTVTDPAMKEQEVFHLDLEVYDDPALTGVGLYLQHTIQESAGPGDIPNTFFPLTGPPVRTLAGSGSWTTLGWDIENAGFRSFQQGVADFRVGVVGSARVCVDRAELMYFPRPVGLKCKARGGDVDLTWENKAAYDGIQVLRDGDEVAALPGTATSHTDTGVPEGDHRYQLMVSLGGAAGGPECAVSVFIVPDGTKVSVDLGETDVEDGLSNVLGLGPSDGENELAICGPEGDLREGRSNLGSDDPTPDAPDGVFYFTVTAVAMKAQAEFKLRVTVYDDPARAGAPIALQHTIAESTGPEDIPNTFFPLENPPANTLAGSGAWVELEWTIENAGFRSFQQGVADFRLIVADAGRVCIDKVELIFGDEGPPPDPAFHRGDADQNAKLELTDAIQVLGYLFLGSATRVPECFDAADADDNGELQLTDAIKILGYLFLGSGPPPSPGPPPDPCGPDPTADQYANSECAYAGC
ncbi:MAG: hypothetical protein HY721_03175 [Planctomycetes bacterium]|nr:hypothetical protein [Planctomycetota bacterium]